MWIVLFHCVCPQYESEAVRQMGHILVFAPKTIMLKPPASWNSTGRPGADAAAVQIDDDEGDHSYGALATTSPLIQVRTKQDHRIWNQEFLHWELLQITAE